MRPLRRVFGLLSLARCLVFCLRVVRWNKGVKEGRSEIIKFVPVRLDSAWWRVGASRIAYQPLYLTLSNHLFTKAFIHLCLCSLCVCDCYARTVLCKPFGVLVECLLCRFRLTIISSPSQLTKQHIGQLLSSPSLIPPLLSSNQSPSNQKQSKSNIEKTHSKPIFWHKFNELTSQNIHQNDLHFLLLWLMLRSKLKFHNEATN